MMAELHLSLPSKVKWTTIVFPLFGEIVIAIYACLSSTREMAREYLAPLADLIPMLIIVGICSLFSCQVRHHLKYSNPSTLPHR